MKTLKLMLVAGAVLAASIVHSAAGDIGYFECGGANVNPPHRDPDPIYKTMIRMVDNSRGQLGGFYVEHYSASGSVYQRDDQYYNVQYWSDNQGDHWSGVMKKNPKLVMVGSLFKDYRRNQIIYLELIFRGSKIETAITNYCQPTARKSETRVLPRTASAGLGNLH
jgi:hypothetical protein